MSDRCNSDKSPLSERLHRFLLIAGFVITVFFYVGIPAILLWYVIPNHLVEQSIQDLTINWQNFELFLQRWLYAGIPVAILSIPVWFLHRGSKSHLIFSVVQLIASIIWVVFVLNFGDMSNIISVTYKGARYEIGVIIQGLMYLIVFLKCIKVLTIYAVYVDNREEYLNKN